MVSACCSRFTPTSGRAERIRAKRVLLTEGQRRIADEFEIEQIVDEGVGAHAADMRSKRAIDPRLGETLSSPPVGRRLPVAA
jgi:hypothetical protein